MPSPNRGESAKLGVAIGLEKCAYVDAPDAPAEIVETAISATIAFALARLSFGNRH
jgi:hypothetical protein